MEPKLCIDCKHYVHRMCEHPSFGFSLVDGKKNSIFCVTARGGFGQCKPEAILFEPQEAVIYDMADLFPNLKGAEK